VEKSAKDFMALYQNMAKEEGSMSQGAVHAGLRFEPIFAKHAEENQKKAKDVMDGVEQVALVLSRK
jgi:hypothetical protein